MPPVNTRTRDGSLSQAETETRRLAYAIKDPRSPARDFEASACEMAARIQSPCWLVPIPASDGSTRANTILALTSPGLSTLPTINHQLSTINRFASLPRLSAALGPLNPNAPATAATCPRPRPSGTASKPRFGAFGCRQVYFVDNVATSGTTMRAAYAAMHRGAGLVFADAALSRRPPPSVFRPPPSDP